MLSFSQHPARRLWAALWLAAALIAPGSALAQGVPTVQALQAAHEMPAHVSGREFAYDYKTDTIVVRGNALLTQGATVLQADELQYTRNRREARAYGHVHLTDPAVEITASEAELNLMDETGRLLDADIRVRTGGSYHLTGKEIDKFLGQRYAVKDGYFTTCGCEDGRVSWSIAAEELNVHLGGTGSAEGARFNVLGYPVLKLPYAWFPANSDRSSGFLSPRMGESHLRGFQYLQPFYLAINQSSDATVAVDVESLARVGGLAEYRLRNGADDYFMVDGAYYDESLRANRENDVIDSQIADPNVPLDRYGIIGLTREHLTPDLTLYADTVSVSDSLYLREMNVYTMSRGFGSNFGVLRDAQSDFGLLQSFNGGFLRLDGVWNQDLIQDQRFALQTLPEAVLSGRRDLFGGLLYSDYDAQVVNFWRSDGVGGWRFDLNPRVTMPVRWGDYLTGFGTVGARETVYDTSGHDVGVIPVGTDRLTYNNGLTLDGLTQGGLQSRELVYASAGISSEMEKVYDLNWDSIDRVKHTIEPLVTYSYVPNVAQGNLPLFDETDRVNPRSMLTYGVVSRLFIKSAPQVSATPSATSGANEGEAESPMEALMQGAPPGGWAHEVARLTLLQDYDMTHQLALDGSHMSDVDINASLFPTSIASFGGSVGYSPSETKISYVNAYLNLRPPWAVGTARSPLYMGHATTGPFLQFMYNFVGGGEASHTMAAQAYYELFDRIGVYYAPLYDFAAGKLLSAEYGVRLKSPCNCWAADFGLSDTTNPNEVSFQFQLTLGGLGSIGRNPFGRNPFSAYEGGHGSGVVPGLY